MHRWRSTPATDRGNDDLFNDLHALTVTCSGKGIDQMREKWDKVLSELRCEKKLGFQSQVVGGEDVIRNPANLRHLIP